MVDTKHAINIKPGDIPQAAITLHRAFETDPMMQWMFVTKENYEQNGIATIKTWIKYCMLYGKAFRTEGFESIALHRKPGDMKMPFWHLLRAGMFKTPKLIGKEGFKRLMLFDELLIEAKKKNMGDRPFWYCWVIGTDPQYQHQGYGKVLMDHFFNLAGQDNLPCYLETASDTAKAIYVHKGYQLLSEFMIPDSQVKISTMLRE